MASRSRVLSLFAAVLATGLGACASLKPPTLSVRGVGVQNVGVTGANLRVRFAVRNPNPEDLVIERFEYELELNGRSLGHGYVADPVTIRGFGEERVASEFNLNFLKVPGTVKSVLQEDRARAKAKGDFYVREKGGLKKIGFDSEAEVDLGR